MLTPVAPSTSNINDRLQCRRHLGLARQSRIPPHPRPTHRFFGRPQMTSPARIEDLSKAMGDVNEVVAAIAVVSTLDQDEALRRKLRRYAGCPDDQPFNLELSVGSAGPTAPTRRKHSSREGWRYSGRDELPPSGRAEPRAPEHDRAGASIDHREVRAAVLPFIFQGVPAKPRGPASRSALTYARGPSP